jgi:micrococcal nuclease
MSHKYILENISKDSIPPLYSLNGKGKWCRILNVYDGDTVDILFVVGDEIQHHKFRLFGIDTPEMKPLKSLENRDAIISLAKLSKSFLESLVLDRVVFIKFCKEEKYGRLMGTIYYDENCEKSINDSMVESGHAKAYFGGKKE